MPNVGYPGLLRKVSRKYHKSIAERLKECLTDSSLLLAYAKELEDNRLSKAAGCHLPVRTRPNELPGLPAGTLEEDPDYPSPRTGPHGG